MMFVSRYTAGDGSLYEKSSSETNSLLLLIFTQKYIYIYLFQMSHNSIQTKQVYVLIFYAHHLSTVLVYILHFFVFISPL